MEKIVIGRKDHADLPLFQLEDVPVKVDTGAYSSSIHCDEIELIQQDTHEILRVVFFGEHNQALPAIEFTTFTTKKVRSSSGKAENRYFVMGTIVLFGKTIKTRFSLTKRQRMRYPILLGRKLLNKRFVVDSSKVDLSKNKLKTTIFIK